MSIDRTSIREFATEKPWYGGHLVYAYTIDATGAKTATKATLYSAPSGTGTLSNPQKLTSRGRFSAPVYIDEPVFLVVENVGTGQSVDTGVVGLGVVGVSVQDAQAAANAALAYASQAQQSARRAKQYGPIISSFSLTVLDDASATAWLTTLGVPLDIQATYTDIKVGSTVVARHQTAASAVNFPQLTPAAASGTVVYGVEGNDTNLGVILKSKGGDPVQILVGSLEVCRFSANTSSVNYANILSGGTTGPVVYGAAGSDANVSIEMLPQGTGSVLLGYSFKLTTAGASTTPLLQITGDSTNEAALAITEFTGSPSGLGAAVILGRSRSGSRGTYTVLQNGDQIGGIFFEGADGVDACQAAAITAEVSGTPGSNDMPTTVFIQTTADGASSPTKRWRVSEAGHLLPHVDNTYDIGSASLGVKEIFADNGTINTSDASRKMDVEATDLGLDFILKLNPVRYRWVDYNVDAVTETRKVMRQKTKLVTKDATVATVEEVDGKRIARMVQETRKVREGVYTKLPVIGDDGQPVFEKVPVYNDDGTVKRFKLKQVFYNEPVMEEVDDVVELAPARKGAFRRLHDGFVAQDVEKALIESGADPRLTRGMFVRDQATGKAALRYTEMLAPMVKAIQEQQAIIADLTARLSALESVKP